MELRFIVSFGFSREEYYNNIRNYLTSLVVAVKLDNKNNLLQLNLHSENFWADFLNLLFNWNLKNINANIHNAPGIDLIDQEHRIVVQVSSTVSQKKIQHSLDEIKKIGYRDYRFCFMAITERSQKFRSFIVPEGLLFDVDSDIFDVGKLLKITQNAGITKLHDMSELIDHYNRNQSTVAPSFNSIFYMSISVIQSFITDYQNDLETNSKNSALNNSIAMCYLKLKLYDKAYKAFSKALDNDIHNSATYFYSAICLLKGKKAFLAARTEIDRVEELIRAALTLEKKGIYLYLWAYVKYDYYFRKYFRTSPTYLEALDMAIQAGLNESDIKKLYELLGVKRPNCL